MTKEEILAMEAGLDLDFQVDIKVMAGKGGYLGCPAYSTDISAAWQVVEKFNDDSGHLWSWQINASKERVMVDLTCPIGHKFPNWHGVTEVEGNSVPEAICKAALITKLANE